MQHHAQTGAIAIAAATLAANLPDPRQPTSVLVLAGLGALTGTAIGRIRRLPREQTRELRRELEVPRRRHRCGSVSDRAARVP